ncbi:VOC family protein [Roseibium litorale]|uniref:VOC family protein n=1 Tax=Roseibium litorale TaxID=2803841 RepID=A0ABR9CRE7_9HYPH|nr:VOC family protein [Roseibium litorale]MBD8893438.1 VOC family protein [Roseibium litorale]
MAKVELEHVNVTVSDPEATARRLCNWFGWHIRWHGPAKDGGTTYHVGTDQSYVALYSAPGPTTKGGITHTTLGGLNHIAVVAGDLDAVERTLIADGIKTHSHGDYEPGRRFYFDDPDGIEYEVVSYTA